MTTPTKEQIDPCIECDIKICSDYPCKERIRYLRFIENREKRRAKK